MKVIALIPWRGFDPTEVAVPWRVLTSPEYARDVTVTFAVCGRAPGDDCDAAAADPIMVTGSGLYLLKWSMRADANGRAAYEALAASGALDRSRMLSFDGSCGSAPSVAAFDALLLPGGHCQDMRPYLEDIAAQKFVAEFAKSGKPVAAVCHGVVLAARSGILSGRRVTALPAWMERVAHTSTRMWMGSYYRTYTDRTVQSEVSAVDGVTFELGPKSLARDSISDLHSGFVVRDGAVLTARWPGDAHRLAFELLDVMGALTPQGREVVARPPPTGLMARLGFR